MWIALAFLAWLIIGGVAVFLWGCAVVSKTPW